MAAIPSRVTARDDRYMRPDLSREQAAARAAELLAPVAPLRNALEYRS